MSEARDRAMRRGAAGRPGPTERRLPASRRLHLMTSPEVVALMLREERRSLLAVTRARASLARAADTVAAALGRGGRLVYAGAGTSGRIAALDAAELGPTFGLPPRAVRVLLAGGPRAMRRAVEGAEDDAEAGARDAAGAVRRGDVLVAVAASGATPYTLGCLRDAARRGAATVAVTAVAGSPLAREADVAVVTAVGPEVLTGSTRLKAATAAKLALNAISTAAMVRLGRVQENLMVDMPLTNAKLRRRGARIVAALARVGPARAQRALRREGSIRGAVEALRPGALGPRPRQEEER